jgi:hypothetical protein
MLVAAASAARLSGATLGTLSRTALVLLEPELAGIEIVRHRSLGEVLAFVGVDDNTAWGTAGTPHRRSGRSRSA